MGDATTVQYPVPAWACHFESAVRSACGLGHPGLRRGSRKERSVSSCGGTDGVFLSRRAGLRRVWRLTPVCSGPARVEPWKLETRQRVMTADGITGLSGGYGREPIHRHDISRAGDDKGYAGSRGTRPAVARVIPAGHNLSLAVQTSGYFSLLQLLVRPAHSTDLLCGGLPRQSLFRRLGGPKLCDEKRRVRL